MQEKSSQHETHLRDWKRSPFVIPDIHLKFELDEKETLVTSRMQVKAAPDRKPEEVLTLIGEEIELISLSINDKQLDKSAFSEKDGELTIAPPSSEFTLEIKTKVCPEKNLKLSGLYKSGNILCTQNEAEGFRRITYFIDRPDIMSRYNVEISADKAKYPYLLSNGNLIESGNLEGGRHYTKWQDPFPKPCYLFALVAGDFGLIEDHYITHSGRKIDLKIYCDRGNESKCLHAMSSLKRAMKWDEEVFGLEYDLDLFMIVAVLSFNFGAMENKGLNIFNANAILVDEKTATDENFMRVERVVAHEYFHNWTGNRVTLRDWFQLTLKEGLTVFRDQDFTQDMHNKGVQRIEDVQYVRRYQFPEDSGPTSHPIKPTSYIKIDNFYTTTIYYKGAEVIRMIKTLLGDALFRKGMDTYFELYDGKAVTTEDFLHAMELAYGQSLKQFSRWYARSGTPVVKAQVTFEDGAAILEVEQKSCEEKGLEPLCFPLAVGFIDKEGKPLSVICESASRVSDKTAVLKVSKAKEKFVFKNIPVGAHASVNRHFSAPIILERELRKEERLFLMQHDIDSFNRWDAAYELYAGCLLEMVEDLKKNKPLIVDKHLLEGIQKALDDHQLDPAFLALMLSLPGEGEIGERQRVIDIEEIHAAREFLKREIGEVFYTRFKEKWQELTESGSSGTDTKAIGQRKLKNICLAYMVATQREEAFEIAHRQFKEAKNMTDQLSALDLLTNYANPFREEALAAFYREWKKEPLVITKWFAVQAGSQIASLQEKVGELLKDPVYDEKVPNNVRALLGTFLQNQYHFHDASGKGYQLISREIIRLDQINPHVAASIALGFKKYARVDDKRQALMRGSLEAILKAPNLSPNVFEIASKCLSNK
ncbi:aminopeptidase N [Estrella lausannensis]|uniref:Aminopeptidase N n=1 Tax=Estrella lausannensis TaxID=483423 RepID=A0A0H5DRB9_9BACT|nr:aminopeptidase N [Estrella lausannensis]CRX39122.1 Aminopeptidase N [Estrella lausannensis]